MHACFISSGTAARFLGSDLLLLEKCVCYFIVFSETHYTQSHYNAIQWGYISMLIETYKAIALENAKKVPDPVVVAYCLKHN